MKIKYCLRLIGKELSRRLLEGKRLYFPYLRIHIVDIESIVRQNRDLINDVGGFSLLPSDNPCPKMKPLFSKMEKTAALLPGDPRRKAFEEQWILAGGDPKDMEGKRIEFDNEEVKKVSLFYKIIKIITTIIKTIIIHHSHHHSVSE